VIEDFEYKGMWWLPAEPEKQVPGTLRFTPNEGATLDLIGSFRDMTQMGTTLDPEIILGFSGKRITLHKCLEIGAQWGGLAQTSFHAKTVFVGAHFQKPEHIKFKALQVHYLYLDEWVNISGFDIEYSSDKHDVVIKYKVPEPIRVAVGDDYRISIWIQSIYPGISMVQKEARIKQKTHIVIEPSEEKSFDEYWNIMYRIRNFLSLGVMERVYPLEIKGETEVNKQMIEGSEAYYPLVEIFYQSPDIPRAPKTIYPYEMLFTFESISDRFESFLRNWFERMELLEPVYNLYFATLYNPRIYLEHKFLSLTQIVEPFHQHVYGGGYLSDEDYKETYDALVNVIPDWIEKDFRESLKTKLKYGNEFSLRKRLRDICNEYWEILSKFIDNKDAFIDWVVDTRNYLVHHDEDLKERTASPRDLFRLNQKLRLIVEICLLTELGFTLEEVKELFATHRRYRQEFTFIE
jgi:hypothetical protein